MSGGPRDAAPEVPPLAAPEALYNPPQPAPTAPADVATTTQKATKKAKSRAAGAAEPAAEARPAVRRSGLSRDKILNVATRMFAEHGFAAISIRDIAGACGISIPSIYHFFDDKDTLYIRCYEHIFRAASAELHAVMMRAEPGRDRIRDFTIGLCDLLLNNHDFRRLFQRELLREERRTIDQLTTHHFRDEFKLLTKELTALTGEKHAMDRAFSIYALVFGLIQMRRIGELAGMSKSIMITPQHLAQHVLAILLPEIDWAE